MAVDHSILVICWHLLSTGEHYTDLGGDYFDKRRTSTAYQKRLIAQLEAMGTPSHPRIRSLTDTTASIPKASPASPPTHRVRPRSAPKRFTPQRQFSFGCSSRAGQRAVAVLSAPSAMAWPAGRPWSCQSHFAPFHQFVHRWPSDASMKTSGRPA